MKRVEPEPELEPDLKPELEPENNGNGKEMEVVNFFHYHLIYNNLKY